MKKSRIRETPTLSTDADSRTDTNLKRLREFFFLFLGGGGVQPARFNNFEKQKFTRILLENFVIPDQY